MAQVQNQTMITRFGDPHRVVSIDECYFSEKVLPLQSHAVPCRKRKRSVGHIFCLGCKQWMDTMIDALSLLSPSDLLLVAVSSGDMHMLHFAMTAAEGGAALSHAVYLAAEFGQTQCLQTLLQGGSSPTDAAMWAACRRGDLAVIQLLVEHGLVFTEQAKDICIRHGHISIIIALQPGRTENRTTM